MLSKQDLQNIQPLKKEIQEIKIDLMLLRQEMNERFDKVYEDMYAMRKELKEDILLFKDDICKLILNLQDDVTVVTEYKDVIEDHEIRIYDLEKYSRPN